MRFPDLPKGQAPPMRIHQSRVVLAPAALIAAAALTACSPPHQVDSTKKVDTALSAQVPTAAATSEASSSEAPQAQAGEDVKIKATKTRRLTASEQITVSITGLNPQATYHAGICSASNSTGQRPNCTGALNDADTQPTLSNQGGIAINEDGTATVPLTVQAQGENVNCASETCAIEVFGDEKSNFVPVASLPVAFS